ncbi:Ger(x)C family spore germination protein [Paenibacillus arenilitoris]|uniref:Ger(X)C family spore germination protein n=1 Tax=Paenibacillus arenilitoris TaxID=2772299 RepID=A0A927H9Y4_9BACL|nr:Ger(x)C family spore germination protein [Paenibacillus arenilitoris]MBD2872089.1 Ger(x)C family spore germination protein [Paenibacillus arenilitoris]
MIRFVLLTCVSLLLVMSASGCTDFIEPNQLAFVLGSAIDHAEDGTIEMSYQIVIPSLQGGPSKGESSGDSAPFFVMSAKGKDVFEATQKIQLKMSRRLLTSHRVLIAISEEFFNKNDASKLFDKLSRDPANNLRDIIIMIKGGSAKEFLMIKHPLEQLSSIAAGKELDINGLKGFSSRELIIDSLSRGIRPLMPIIQIEDKKLSGKKTSPIAALSGFAVLNDRLKVKGLLDNNEGSAAIWMQGKGTFQGVTMPWKNGQGTLSFRLTRLERKLRSAPGNDPGHIVLMVKAQAYLLENTTPLDMSEVKNMLEVQKHINEQIQKDLQLTMDKIRQWGPDVFGIGEFLHRQYPYWWKSQKDDWDEKFKTIDVTVKANVRLRSTGTSGAPLE